MSTSVQPLTGDDSIARSSFRSIEADGVRVFYREAGPTDAPVMLLLHGFPSSSHMFRELIPRLANRYRVIAPDLPGFGFTQVPDERNYRYSFDGLAVTINAFVEALGLKRYALYVFDYGAPVGFRLAVAHPERVTAIVSQNGNAYEEGLSEAWDPIRRYWAEPFADIRRHALAVQAGCKKSGFNCAGVLYLGLGVARTTGRQGHPAGSVSRLLV